MEFFF